MYGRSSVFENKHYEGDEDVLLDSDVDGEMLEEVLMRIDQEVIHPRQDFSLL